MTQLRCMGIDAVERTSSLIVYTTRVIAHVQRRARGSPRVFLRGRCFEFQLVAPSLVE